MPNLKYISKKQVSYLNAPLNGEPSRTIVYAPVVIHKQIKLESTDTRWIWHGQVCQDSAALACTCLVQKSCIQELQNIFLQNYQRF